MVAINFQKRFAHDVASGKKTQTCRPTPDRFHVGDQLQLYTGQRSTGARKLLDAVCTSVTPIRFDGGTLQVDGQLYTADEREAFAKADGFASWQSMIDFFRQTYGTPAFLGYLIKWRPAAAVAQAA